MPYFDWQFDDSTDDRNWVLRHRRDMLGRLSSSDRRALSRMGGVVLLRRELFHLGMIPLTALLKSHFSDVF